jgi:nitroreductase
VLDSARFAPSWGNRQGWHVIVVRDQALRTQLKALYLHTWRLLYQAQPAQSPGPLLRQLIADRQAWRAASLSRPRATALLGWRAADFDGLARVYGLVPGRLGRYARADVEAVVARQRPAPAVERPDIGHDAEHVAER